MSFHHNLRLARSHISFFQGSQGAIIDGGSFVGVNGSHNNICIVASDKSEHNPILNLALKKLTAQERKGKGIGLLLKFCHPEAIHDSGARDDLGCLPGTRKEYIRIVNSWSKGNGGSKKRAFLMIGPAGAGKSAIARTCADNLQASGNLGASFFFYRPSGWNDPKKFIPTIVYQLTTRYPAYRDCVNAIILDDPLILQKGMDIQFWELLVRPLQRPWPSSFSIKEDTVIIVDGLDECATVEAQIKIIRLITTSIHKQTTPFSWAFFSRPEPPITSAFSSDVATNVSRKLPLIVSSDTDSDIEAYIRANFDMIRAKYSIPRDVPWPMEKDIRQVVSQSAGLFVYPVTALRYIGNGSPGLEERLRLVLQLGPISTDNPFAALDRLYMLVLMQIPKGILFDTLSLIFLGQSLEEGLFLPLNRTPDTHECHSALGLSLAAFYATISNLYSVLEVTKSPSGRPRRLKFYHKSFLDFLLDKTRSYEYFLRSSDVLQHRLKRLVQTIASVAITPQLDEDDIPFITMQMFFSTVEELDGNLDEDILQQVSQLDWTYWCHQRHQLYEVDIREFIRKIPKNWRDKIIRPSRIWLPEIKSQILASIYPEQYEARAYDMGRRDKKTRLLHDETRRWRICPIP